MGNVPTKLDQDGNPIEPVSRPGYPSGTTGPSSTGTTISTQSGNDTKTRNRRASSLVSSFLNTGNRYRSGSMQDGTYHSPHKRRSTKEKEQLKEQHARNILVKYDESVDGGFMAPFGSYSYDKLDYDTTVVKSLIIQRRLAPFYTPLQDFDSSWSREELLKIVDGLPLHASFDENPEEFEDIPIGDLNKSNFDHLINKNVSKKEYRNMHSKIFKARLYRKRIIWQETENESFLETKLEVREGKAQNSYLPSDDLKFDLYSNGSECPICFLYFPEPLNYSKCCQQPICTECFVQIKRAEPHFPHEEVDPTKPIKDDSEKDPNLLTSEPSNCPYCATANFSIVYTPPLTRKVGIQGIPPARYISSEINPEIIEPLQKDKNENVTTPISNNIVSSDDIRPDWETKLNKERIRLARRSANATAIHVSNQLIDPDYTSTSNDTTMSSSKRSTNTTSRHGSNSASRGSRQRSRQSMNDLENQMIQEAIRLSLEDEQQNKSPKKK
ncbi:similar to Saccharomyces cerevisiae YMR140W SIP5 Protein of unknown function [Maudiozyma saulgeensis]|uniref:Protein SIP5 n=1 Tax=Maudiozyma saulgeensis TaxID=1789683 RepID=A0A1X7R182_9SACH|nr:similar to Saccharomyces cerevisiae YMR140W SIP5 Protein of unknown function [Kazachstania saulgeensis]